MLLFVEWPGLVSISYAFEQFRCCCCLVVYDRIFTSYGVGSSEGVRPAAMIMMMRGGSLQVGERGCAFQAGSVRVVVERHVVVGWLMMMILSPVGV